MRLLLLLLLTSLPALAELRDWRNTDGSKTFKAEFISSDGTRVTLKRSSDRRIITFPLAKLHADDKAWVSANAKPLPGKDNEVIPEGAAFDTLEFGDSREEVEAKLKKSPRLTYNVNDNLFGRTGLNGIFKTKSTIGGKHCYLYFDWTKSGHLREVTLQTKPADKLEYNGSIKSTWGELIELLTMLHGNPVQTMPFPKSSELQDGLMLGSHLWYTEEGHSVILCTGQERDKYTAAVRITTEHIVPVRTDNNGSASPSSGRRVAPR